MPYTSQEIDYILRKEGVDPLTHTIDDGGFIQPLAKAPAPIVPTTEVVTPPGLFDTARRGVTQAIGPTITGGLGAGLTAAALAGLGSGIGTIPSAILLGLGGLGGGMAGNKLQEALVPEEVKNSLFLRQEDSEANPKTAAASSLIPSLMFGNPIKGAKELLTAGKGAVATGRGVSGLRDIDAQVLKNAAIGSGVNAGISLVQNGELTPQDALLAALGGSLFNAPWKGNPLNRAFGISEVPDDFRATGIRPKVTGFDNVASQWASPLQSPLMTRLSSPSGIRNPNEGKSPSIDRPLPTLPKDNTIGLIQGMTPEQYYAILAEQTRKGVLKNKAEDIWKRDFAATKSDATLSPEEQAYAAIVEKAKADSIETQQQQAARLASEKAIAEQAVPKKAFFTKLSEMGKNLQASKEEAVNRPIPPVIPVKNLEQVVTEPFPPSAEPVKTVEQSKLEISKSKLEKELQLLKQEDERISQIVHDKAVEKVKEIVRTKNRTEKDPAYIEQRVNQITDKLLADFPDLINNPSGAENFGIRFSKDGPTGSARELSPQERELAARRGIGIEDFPLPEGMKGAEQYPTRQVKINPENRLESTVGHEVGGHTLIDDFKNSTNPKDRKFAKDLENAYKDSEETADLVGEDIARRLELKSKGTWKEKLKDYIDDVLNQKDLIRKAGARAVHDAPFGTRKELVNENTLGDRFKDMQDIPRDSFGVRSMVSPNPDNEDIRNSKDQDRDAEHIEAVKRGDTVTAQRLVDERAREAGYTVLKMYHGTQKHFYPPNTFDLDRTTMGRIDKNASRGGISFSPDRKFAESYAGIGGEHPGDVYTVYLKTDNTASGKDPKFAKYYEDVIAKNHEEWLRTKANPKAWDLLDSAGKLSEEKIAARVEKIRQSTREAISKEDWGRMENPKMLRDGGYDSAYTRENANHYRHDVRNMFVLDPKQIKSASHVTLDNDGNVIPLSKRFSQDTGDIRYSKDREYDPSLTAISRTSESSVMQLIRDKGLIADTDNVLHAGAGRSNNPDRAGLSELARQVKHYDPGVSEDSNRSGIGEGQHDKVVSPFVLNVLPVNDRISALRDIASSLKPDGSAIIAVRGATDVPPRIEGAANKPGWTPHSDGWLVPNSGKKTFQRGFTTEQLKAELTPFFENVEIIRGGKAPVAIVSKPITDKITGDIRYSRVRDTVHFFQSEIESIRHDADTAKIATHLEKLFNTERSLKGRLVEYPLHEYRKAIGLSLKNPIAFLYKGTNAMGDKIWKYALEMRDNGASNIKLSPEEKNAYSKLREFYDNIAKERNSYAGLHQGALHPHYVNDTLSVKAADILSKNSQSFAANTLKKDYVNHQIKALTKAGRTPEEAAKMANGRLAELLASFQHDKKTNLADHFGPLDAAAGYGLPESMRSSNPMEAMQSFGSRAAKRIAYHKEIETTPAKDMLFDSMQENLSANPKVAHILDSFTGLKDRADSVTERASGVIASAMTGTFSGARDVVSTQFLGAAHSGLGQLPVAIGSSIKNFHRNWSESMKNGVRTEHFAAISSLDSASGLTGVLTGLGKLREVMNVVQGRSLLESVARTMAYGQGKFLAADNVMLYKDGKLTKGSQQEKFLDDFGPSDWRKKKLTEADLQEMAAKYTQVVQQTYNPLDLPKFAVDSPIAPFLQLARWNIGKANHFVKYVVEPAQRGNFKPLLNAVAVTLLGGGAALESLNELISKRKSKLPSISELTATNEMNGKTAKMLGYKLAGMAALSGFGGEMSNLVKMAYDKQIGNKSNGYEFLVQHQFEVLSETIPAIIKAASSGDVEKTIDVISIGLENTFQNYRVAMNHLSEKKEGQIEHANKFRDKRLYEQSFKDNTAVTPDIKPDYDSYYSSKFRKLNPDTVSGNKPVGAMARDAIKEVMSSGDNYQDKKEKLTSLKRGSQQFFPDPETSPMEAAKFSSFLMRSQGKNNRYQEFERGKQFQKMKGELIPSL